MMDYTIQSQQKSGENPITATVLLKTCSILMATSANSVVVVGAALGISNTTLSQMRTLIAGEGRGVGA